MVNRRLKSAVSAAFQPFVLPIDFLSRGPVVLAWS